MSTTITKPTVTQLEEAPQGAILNLWQNKEDFKNNSNLPNVKYVKIVDKFQRKVWYSADKRIRFSNDLLISIWYKAKLEY